MSPKEFSEALDRIRDGFLHTMAVEPDTIKKYGGV